MKNNKTYFIYPVACLIIFFSPIFSVAGYCQTINKSGAIEKCFIVSDIHFNPLYGASKDTSLKRKLQKASFEEWKKYFESTPAQATINKTLLFQDANYAILKSALTNMEAKLPHPAFIIIAGDFIWHNATISDSILKRKSIQFIARLFKEHFPGVAIIPAMGNNDTYGNDYDIQDSRFLNDFANAWSPNLPKASAAELKANGYYTTTKGNLKLVVINSAFLYSGTNYPQAATMLSWVQNNLANTHGKYVWIISHIPPGINGYNSTNFWNADYTQTFVNDVIKYSSIVKFGIASHTHFNDFKVFYDASQTPVSFMRIAPSICANHGNNPSFEVAEFDASSGKIVHETNYYLNLTVIPKEKSVTQAEWNNTFSLPKSLEMEKIDASSFSKLLNDIKNDQTNRLLCKYTRFYSVGTSTDSPKTINRPVMLKYLQTDSLKGN